MNNNLQIFKHEIFGELTVYVDEKEQPWFPAIEVASILGYSNPRDAILKHCKKDGVVFCDVTDSLGRQQQKKFINEGNLYRLIVKSKLPEAEKFEEWVFEEVLPTIRKTGGYIANEELFINTYLPFADEQTKLLFKGTLEVIRKQNEIIQKQQKEIEYKEDVIIGLVDNVDLAKKRNFKSSSAKSWGKI